MGARRTVLDSNDRVEHVAFITRSTCAHPVVLVITSSCGAARWRCFGSIRASSHPGWELHSVFMTLGSVRSREGSPPILEFAPMRRSLEDEKKARMGVVECVSHGLVEAYPVMWDKEGMLVLCGAALSLSACVVLAFAQGSGTSAPSLVCVPLFVPAVGRVSGSLESAIFLPFRTDFATGTRSITNTVLTLLFGARTNILGFI